MKRLLNLIKNKYFLAAVAFVVWMLFFDRNDLASQYAYRSQVNKLEEEKDFYIQKISQVEKDLQELNSNQEKLEKFARERYFMKKDNEDVYVIIDNQPEEKKSFSLF
jgi:cell division protein FtsB